VAAEIATQVKTDEAHGGIHMPFQSIYPFLASAGILVGAIGVSIVDPASPSQYPGFWGPKIAVTLLGGAIMFVSVVLWSLEGNDGYHIHLNEDGSIKGEGAHAGHDPGSH